MKCNVLSLLVSSLILTSLAAAQARGGNRSTSGATLPGGVLEPPNHISGARPLFLSGKVAVEDGTPLTDPAMIQTHCQGRIHTEGYTDSKGNFSFQIGSKDTNGASTDQAMDSAPSMISSSPSSSSSMSNGGSRTPNGTGNGDLRDCQLQAVLAGFQSQVVELANHLGDFQVDVGTIKLHRLSQVDGFTVSATSAAAPNNAKKEFEKGRELAKKQKWDAALENYQKATEAYPKYAVAWYELGNVQLQRNDPAAAREAFHKSVNADPKFVSPYFALTQMAAHDKNWQEVHEMSSEVLKLNPVSFPQYWMFNSAANYYMLHYDVAEQSAARGLEVDSNHKFPQLEHLMGMILAQKHDYTGASEHLKNYLQLAPSASDAAAAQKQLSEYQQLSANASK